MNKLQKIMSLVDGPYNVSDSYYEPPHRKRARSKKQYTNKNANVEYYTDEHGNIRRRKK